jgi:hypothetical protein
MTTRIEIPLSTDDPIHFLLDNGWTMLGLAVEWGFRTTDTVYRLRRYEYVPPAETAAKMGETFGWTAGQVIDHWLKRRTA